MTYEQEMTNKLKEFSDVDMKEFKQHTKNELVIFLYGIFVIRYWS